MARSIAFKPFKFIKRILPKTLLSRALTILITPIVLVQLITGYVFWDRHWSKYTEKLAGQIAMNVVATLNLASTMREDEFPGLQAFARSNFHLEISHSPPNGGNPFMFKGREGWREKFISDALQHRMSYPFHVRIKNDQIHIQISTLRGTYTFEMPKRTLFPKSTPILLWWEIGAPIFFMLVAILFMRNQIRPLRAMVEWVDAFGKGRAVMPIKPAGSLEIRRLSLAFNDMRERIQRQITQRTEMLAGISHDLKTPLTRMELQLAMMPPGEDIQMLREDVKEMEKMVEEYLAFARGEESETPTPINVIALLEEIISRNGSPNITFQHTDEVFQVQLRPLAIKRALKNLLSNGLRYGTHVWITLYGSKKNLTVLFDDDGPGIPANRREDVFRPFVRLDTSRNSQTGGYGLGLSITRDIITAHGGTIFLQDSPRGGLQVVVNLPL